jgi:hypothetical protein
MNTRASFMSVVVVAAIGLLLGACSVNLPARNINLADLLSEGGVLITPITEGVGSIEREEITSDPAVVDLLGRGGVTLMGASIGGGTLIEAGAEAANVGVWTSASNLLISVWMAPSASAVPVESPNNLIARGTAALTADGPGRYVIATQNVTFTEGPNDATLKNALRAGTFDVYVEFQVLTDDGALQDAYFGELRVEDFTLRLVFSARLL